MKGTFGIPCFQWVGILCGFWLVMSANSAQAEYLDRLLILDLLRSSQFEELEQKLVRQERLYKQKKIPEEHMATAYSSFANSDPELEIRLNEWVGKRKLAGIAYLARGIYYCNLGWTTRGARFISETPQDRVRGMKQYFALARKDLEEAIRIKPNLGIAYKYMISIAMSRGDRQGLEQYTFQGLEANPRSFVIRWQYLYSLLPWWSGLSNEESLVRIKQFVKDYVGPKSSDLQPLRGFPDFVKAEILSRWNQKKEAIPYYEKSLSHGQYYLYSHKQGSNYYYMGRYVEAYQKFTQALSARPQVAATHKFRGKTLAKLGKNKEALKEFNTALQLDTHDPDTLVELSYVLTAEERYQEAIDFLKKGLIYGAHDEYVVEKLGRVYLYELHQPAQGLKYLKRATELDSKSKTYWYNYALALYRLNDCRAVPAFHQYQTRCHAGGKCAENNIAGAKGGIKSLLWNMGCWSQIPASSVLKEVFGYMFPF